MKFAEQFYLCMPYLIGCDKMSSVWHRKGCLPVKGNEESPFLSTRGCFCGGTKFHRKTSSKLKKMLLLAFTLVFKSTKDQDRLDNLRCQRFTEKVLKSLKVVERQTLPPTPAAAKFHSLRVYFQVNEWKGNPLDLDPKEWGSKEKDGQLLPIPRDQLPAPDYLTEVVHCNSETGCNTLRCNCRKHGIDCSSICGDCKGTCCDNSVPLEIESDED